MKDTGKPKHFLPIRPADNHSHREPAESRQSSLALPQALQLSLPPSESTKSRKLSPSAMYGVITFREGGGSVVGERQKEGSSTVALTTIHTPKVPLQVWPSEPKTDLWSRKAEKRECWDSWRSIRPQGLLSLLGFQC